MKDRFIASSKKDDSSETESTSEMALGKIQDSSSSEQSGEFDNQESSEIDDQLGNAR